MIRKPMLALMMAASIILPAYACQSVAVAAGTCTMQETVTLTVNYNFKAKSFAEAKQKFDAQIAKVSEYAKGQQIKKFDLQNQNYNIYSQPVSYNPDGTPDTYSYQVTGSSNYIMDNADAAFKFAEFLTNQKMQVGLNSNSYRNGNCNSNTTLLE
jgi:uncharacterized protein YggE